MSPATMSGRQFDALPYEEGRHWELLEGNLVEVSSPTPRSRTVEVYNVSGSTIFNSTQNIISSLLPELNLPVASLFE